MDIHTIRQKIDQHIYIITGALENGFQIIMNKMAICICVTEVLLMDKVLTLLVTVYLNVINNGIMEILLKFNMVILQTHHNVVKYQDPGLRKCSFHVILMTNTTDYITKWKIGIIIPTMLKKIVQRICIIVVVGGTQITEIKMVLLEYGMEVT